MNDLVKNYLKGKLELILIDQGINHLFIIYVGAQWRKHVSHENNEETNAEEGRRREAKDFIPWYVRTMCYFHIKIKWVAH